MASHQKRGFGGTLIRAFEQEARRRHMRHFWFDARKTAARFYQRLGFEGYGDEFQKNDRAYIRMQKIL
ncbi:GNAT family N-acetyltransferase [Planktotalea sp.]|uniref:GNAT family N-acetyltransferase n=1 Tax=Planktotalea sp. TaxID=2029877 RepID=UPI00344BC2B8